MTRHFANPGLVAQSGAIKKCKRRHKSIGLYVVAGVMWLVLWFMVGAQIWRVVE